MLSLTWFWARWGKDNLWTERCGYVNMKLIQNLEIIRSEIIGSIAIGNVILLSVIIGSVILGSLISGGVTLGSVMEM